MAEGNTKSNETVTVDVSTDTRQIGGGLQINMGRRRRRSVSENILTFAVIPSLLMWTVGLLAMAGSFDTAVQVSCAALAGGFVGWCMGELR